VLQTIEKAQARLLPHGETAPVSEASVSEATAKLDALLRLVEEQTQTPSLQQRATTGKVVVRAQSRLLLVDQKEICFASIEEGTITVVTPTVEGHSNCRTIEELQSQLDPEMFWRAHRSYLVNIQHIREVVPWFTSSYQIRMDDPKKTEIPVSRAQTKRLRELFNL
jgi:two-component system LytT family response regulator/two-component system response regulator LytT